METLTSFDFRWIFNGGIIQPVGGVPFPNNKVNFTKVATHSNIILIIKNWLKVVNLLHHPNLIPPRLLMDVINMTHQEFYTLCDRYARPYCVPANGPRRYDLIVILFWAPTGAQEMKMFVRRFQVCLKLTIFIL